LSPVAARRPRPVRQLAGAELPAAGPRASHTAQAGGWHRRIHRSALDHRGAGSERNAHYTAAGADTQDCLNECLTGRRWPVLIEGQHLALERAYLAQRARGGSQWVLTSLTARSVMREPEPGRPPREMRVVESFDRLWPRETCAADTQGTASLLNTHWRLVEIDGQPVSVGAGQREPCLQLSTEGHCVSGRAGCNPLSGGLEQGDELRFKGLANTRMACTGEVGEQEARVLAALNASTSSRIVGETLQLPDMQGRLRVRFEALYLR